MKNIAQFITMNEPLVLVSLFSVVIILMIIIIVTDLINKKKANQINEELNYKEEAYSSKNLDNTITEIKYVNEDDPELEKSKAKIELEELKQELIRKEQEEKQIIQPVIEPINVEPTIVEPVVIKPVENIEPIVVEPIKIEVLEDNKEEEKHDLKESKVEIVDIGKPTMDIDEVVAKQEKNAIISLDQFNELSDKLYELNEEIQYQDDGNEPISIQELEELYKTKELNLLDIQEEKPIEKKVEIIEPVQTIKIEPSKMVYNESKEDRFKNSPIISPVYGYKEVNDVLDITNENTADLEKLSEELRKTNEFLNALKELRKNLQ